MSVNLEKESETKVHFDHPVTAPDIFCRIKASVYSIAVRKYLLLKSVNMINTQKT